MKRIISLLLSLALAVGMLAGCTTVTEDEEIRNSELEIRNVSSNETVDNCFLRSECAETRSNASEACPHEQNDYVSRDEDAEDPEPEPEPELEIETKPEPEIDLESIPYGTKVGERFKDLSITDLSGNKVNTADLRGKIIIFNLWATWCPPCVAELPGFNEIASEYADDVVIVAVHVYDSAMHGMPSYVETNFPDTKIIFAYDTPYSDAYIAAGGTRYVPQTAIIDRNGVILYSAAGGLSESWLKSFIENNQ